MNDPIIRSQVVTLRVMYRDLGDESGESKDAPADWNWDEIVDEPINGAVEVLAAGPVVEYPRPSAPALPTESVS